MKKTKTRIKIWVLFLINIAILTLLGGVNHKQLIKALYVTDQINSTMTQINIVNNISDSLPDYQIIAYEYLTYFSQSSAKASYIKLSTNLNSKISELDGKGNNPKDIQEVGKEISELYKQLKIATQGLIRIPPKEVNNSDRSALFAIELEELTNTMTLKLEKLRHLLTAQIYTTEYMFAEYESQVALYNVILFIVLALVMLASSLIFSNYILQLHNKKK